MKERSLILVVFLLCAGSFPCFCQTTYKAVVQDSITQKAMAGVQIYLENDTKGFQNKADGSFSVQVKEGSVIRLRKPGYQWLNVEIQKYTPNTLSMLPSAKSSERKEKIDEIIVDGKPLPKEEWDDIHPDYIEGIITTTIKNDKFKLEIRTKRSSGLNR